MLDIVQKLIDDLAENYLRELSTPLHSFNENRLLEMDFREIADKISTLPEEKLYSGVFELASNEYFRCYIPFAISCTVTIDEVKNRYIYNFGSQDSQLCLIHLQRLDQTKVPNVVSKEFIRLPPKSSKFVSSTDCLLLDQFDSPSLLIIDETKSSSYAAVYRHDIQAYAGVFLNDLPLSRLMYSLRVLSYCKGEDVIEILTRYQLHTVQAVRDEAQIGLRRINASLGQNLTIRQHALLTT
ncbi:MAG: hypothetical protein KJ930_09680 [Gammaproteobacteria bacterium]|jgi:hypothetical protein|nr:hypothetical protein [Gammaproteobacteria bacterium]MBU2179690.1 hypothetical protein [Gammaproteobacteria bacterium]MBU2223298.1 hypothetical protein [Gammaproteobacteria bacterium]MBU2277665.1 hypothetical protein [Gammaproteobacteria bacterium]MBU2428788.1 hypothetical protein [Gammaproteobacteria bacterium]